MKRILTILAVSAIFTACSAKNDAVPTIAPSVSPASMASTTSASEPAAAIVPVSETPSPTREPMPVPTPTPESTEVPVPAGVVAVLTELYARLNKGDFADIPASLTWPYLFDYGKTANLRGSVQMGHVEVISGVSEENYLTALRVSEYAVGEVRILYDGAWSVDVTSKIPDFREMSSAFRAAQGEDYYSDIDSDSETGRADYSRDIENIYYAEQLSALFPVDVVKTSIVVVEKDGEFKIQTDAGLLDSVSQYLKSPFVAPTSLYGRQEADTPYNERRRYIDQFLTVERHGDTLLITNNGGKNITGLTITHFPHDNSGGLLGQYFDECFIPRGGFGYFQAKYYNLRPGYQFEVFVGSRYKDYAKGMSEEQTETLIADIWLENDEPYKPSASVAEFGAENIRVDHFALSESSAAVGFNEKSIVDVKVTNLSADKTITAMVLRAAFKNGDGAVRSESVFNLLDETESIAPGETYVLQSDYFFTAFGTPDYLNEDDCEIAPLDITCE